jgi:hypothetical protein
MSWQNWTVATKFTVAVEGNLNALKSANKSRAPLSTWRAGNMLGSRGHLKAVTVYFVSQDIPHFFGTQKAPVTDNGCQYVSIKVHEMPSKLRSSSHD